MNIQRVRGLECKVYNTPQIPRLHEKGSTRHRPKIHWKNN